MQSVKLVLGCFVLTQAIKLNNEESKALCENINNIPKIVTPEAQVVSNDAAKKEVIAA